ncbi:MAG: hypothetical protein LH629_12255 [Ignavibacteria bacterium]|nr:hypothetical protein [Ignavibacteria bacterium]
MAKLFIYEFKIKSSYLLNIENDCDASNFDTLQWWVDNNVTWRIRLFDIDSDIHIHKINRVLEINEIDELMRKRYEDIMVGRYDFDQICINDQGLLFNKMKSGTLETNDIDQFGFWNHDARKYISQSNPSN